jgi:hypothetical protein
MDKSETKTLQFTPDQTVFIFGLLDEQREYEQIVYVVANSSRSAFKLIKSNPNFTGEFFKKSFTPDMVEIDYLEVYEVEMLERNNGVVFFDPEYYEN